MRVSPYALLTLAIAGTTLAHRDVWPRQDVASADASSTDPSVEASADPSADASPSPSDAASAAASAAASPAASASASAAAAGDSSGSLGGAGTNGGALPVACVACEDTYESVNTCHAQLSSESCSPICSNYTSSVNCVDCLIANGQSGLSFDTAQQVVWDIEAECSSLGISVATQDLASAVTATGPFTSFVTTAASTATASTTSTPHSGITDYATTTRAAKVTGSVYTSYAVDPSNSSSGSLATRQVPLNERALTIVGAITIGAIGLGAVLL